MRQMALATRRVALIRGSEGRAEEAGVEQDDLHPLPLRSKRLGMVDPVSAMTLIRERHVPELQEELLGVMAARELRAGIVLPVVVIVPGREVRDGASQGDHARQSAGLSIGLLQALDQLGLRDVAAVAHIAVDVVAKEEELWPVGQDGLPDRLRLLLIGTGAKRDPRVTGGAVCAQATPESRSTSRVRQ